MERIRTINWKKGGSSIFVLSLCTLGMFFIILLVELGNGRLCHLIATTRADAIADSTASYAQSYDYKFNQNRAREMEELLAEANADNGRYQITTTISFPDTDTLTVTCNAKTRSYFTDQTGVDSYSSEASATVRSVNIFGHLFVIP